MPPGPRPIALFATAAVGLLVTVGIGLWLRLGLAGLTPLHGDFGFVRHAHTHAGYYLVLFPLAWLAWGRLGTPAPGARLAPLYGLAALAAIVAFALQGYALASIVASSIVGAIWLASAAKARRAAPGWLAVAPVGILLATCFVPPIGLSSRRDPAFTQALVQSFLSVLLLFVLIPTALATLRLRAPPPLLWGGLSALSCAFLGAWPKGPLGVALSVQGLLLARALWRAPAQLPLRLAWGGVALGLMAAGLHGAPPSGPRAIAAVHALVLGPLFVTLAPPGRAFTWLALVAAAGMGAALVGVEAGLDGTTSNLLAALAGALWLPAGLAGVRALVVRPDLPPRS